MMSTDTRPAPNNSMRIATVLVGGLLSTLLLALVCLPALYVLTARREGLPPEAMR